jgi:DNA-directed RNA polymerase subunit beta'
MGIQAFEPVLTEGNAIRLHPLVCKGFNADFDGDQMAVHLPLSIEAQVEAKVLLMSTNNIFSPANGKPIITPSQDMVLGCYHLTATRGTEGEPTEPGDGMTFHGPAEVLLAHGENRLGVHARIRVRLPIARKVIGEVPTEEGVVIDERPRTPNGLVKTTVGRVLFNDCLPAGMAFYDLPLTGKNLSRIIADCYRQLGRGETIALLDRVKELGFREATRSGLSFATADLRAPEGKAALLARKEAEVARIHQQYDEGNLTEEERSGRVIELWTEARDQIGREMMAALRDDRRDGKPYLNPVYLMAHSGARGGEEQLRQLAGMRGLMARPSGKIVETPIKSS